MHQTLNHYPSLQRKQMAQTTAQERQNTVTRSVLVEGSTMKCPYDTFPLQVPDCCIAAAAAAGAQEPFPRPPSGYETRCGYDDCHRRTPFQEDVCPQVSSRTSNLYRIFWQQLKFKVLKISLKEFETLKICHMKDRNFVNLKILDDPLVTQDNFLMICRLQNEISLFRSSRVTTGQVNIKNFLISSI